MFGFVDDVGDAFSDVGGDDAVAAAGLEGGDLVGDGGAAGFAEEGFQADVVDEEFVGDAEGEAALEGEEGVDGGVEFGLWGSCVSFFSLMCWFFGCWTYLVV